MQYLTPPNGWQRPELSEVVISATGVKQISSKTVTVCFDRTPTSARLPLSRLRLRGQPRTRSPLHQPDRDSVDMVVQGDRLVTETNDRALAHRYVQPP